MRLLGTLFLVFFTGLTLSPPVFADDVTDVRKAVIALSDAHNTADLETLAKYIHPRRSLFNYQGQLLVVSNGFDREAWKADFDAGWKYD